MHRLKVKTEALKKAQADMEAAIRTDKQKEEEHKASRALPKIGLQEALALLLAAPDMEQLHALLAEWNFKPRHFDDWRETVPDPQDVAVVYRAAEDGEDGAFVKLYASPLCEGYTTMVSELPAHDGDNWLFGVEGLERWGKGADALRATLEELFEKEATAA